MNPESIWMDLWAEGEDAACCGVNLAFGVLEVVFCYLPKWCKRVLSDEFGVDLDGRLGGRGARCLLWGEPGVRSFGVVFVFYQNGAREYFRMNPESIWMDLWAEGEDAACCGVNLAFGVFVFSQVLKRAPSGCRVFRKL
jgi:hypothetical protein